MSGDRTVKGEEKMGKPVIFVSDDHFLKVRLALEKFGRAAQFLKLMEELGELQSELARYFLRERDLGHDSLCVASEVADVLNMLLSLQLIWPDVDIGALMEEKMKRLKLPE